LSSQFHSVVESVSGVMVLSVWPLASGQLLQVRWWRKCKRPYVTSY